MGKNFRIEDPFVKKKFGQKSFVFHALFSILQIIQNTLKSCLTKYELTEYPNNLVHHHSCTPPIWDCPLGPRPPWGVTSAAHRPVDAQPPPLGPNEPFSHESTGTTSQIADARSSKFQK